MAADPPAQSAHQRAGVYVRQPTGYRAFIPRPLPPDPPARFDGALLALLSDADRALGRLDGSIQALPDPDLFTLMYVRKEAVLSSQIEGTQSSLQDLLAAEAQVLDPVRPRDVVEVVNYIAALRHGLERLDTLPVSIRLIREIHGLLLEGVRGSHLTPGELRTSQNWVGPPGCTLMDAAFVPPPPHEVAAALGDLERFIHASVDLPLLVQVGLAHAQLETIHPFLDGNGRVGRLLITFLLCWRKALHEPVLYLSHYLKQHRAAYYEALQAVRDRGAWEEWIVFFLTGVCEVSAHAAATARNILALREEHRARITEHLGRGAANGHRLLESLYTRPIVSVAAVQELTGTTFPAANQLVARLEEQGVLHEFTGRRRNRLFRYDAYIALFDDGGDSAESEA
jgi:Fic family protein